MERIAILQAAGMQFPDGVQQAMINLVNALSQAEFDSLVSATQQLSDQPSPNNNVALAYIAFQFRQGAE